MVNFEMVIKMKDYISRIKSGIQKATSKLADSYEYLYSNKLLRYTSFVGAAGYAFDKLNFMLPL